MSLTAGPLIARPLTAGPLIIGLLTDAPREWTDIPGVRLLGVVLGALFLYAAIRAMFGRRGR